MEVYNSCCISMKPSFLNHVNLYLSLRYQHNQHIKYYPRLLPGSICLDPFPCQNCHHSSSSQASSPMILTPSISYRYLHSDSRLKLRSKTSKAFLPLPLPLPLSLPQFFRGPWPCWPYNFNPKLLDGFQSSQLLRNNLQEARPAALHLSFVGLAVHFDSWIKLFCNRQQGSLNTTGAIATLASTEKPLAEK